jgi:F-type H+-transporting ATPase subunit b
MNIDWFTLIAQIVNFLILVGLLWFFLFRRIIRAMDERERRIARRFEEADEQQAQAEQHAESLQKKQRELEQERESRIQRMRAEIQREKQRMLDEARTEVDRQARQWRESLSQQKKAFVRILREHSAAAALSLTRQAMDELMDSDAYARMADVFMKHIADIDSQQRSSFLDAARSSGNTATLATGFDLAEEDQRRVSRGVQSALGGDVSIQCETGVEKLSGLELRADGRRISWTIDSYFEGLEERITEAFSVAGARENAGAESGGAAAQEKKKEKEA